VACCNQLCEQHHKWGRERDKETERGRERESIRALRERDIEGAGRFVMGGWKIGETVSIGRGGGGGGGGV